MENNILISIDEACELSGLPKRKLLRLVHENDCPFLYSPPERGVKIRIIKDKFLKLYPAVNEENLLTIDEAVLMSGISKKELTRLIHEEGCNFVIAPPIQGVKTYILKDEFVEYLQNL